MFVDAKENGSIFSSTKGGKVKRGSMHPRGCAKEGNELHGVYWQRIVLDEAVSSSYLSATAFTNLLSCTRSIMDYQRSQNTLRLLHLTPFVIFRRVENVKKGIK